MQLLQQINYTLKKRNQQLGLDHVEDMYTSYSFGISAYIKGLFTNNMNQSVRSMYQRKTPPTPRVPPIFPLFLQMPLP